ncbi:NAD(P)-dependent oxidoreductase [Nocardia asteroides]|uniref:NAD(P)-dependent oxidoreductase n=1 Tax=Nocardia asteroides TaxID=1824 RepID=UPI001E2D6007|nr:NAD(P)H-binding protein [Nocardia asteroides]UGT64344.1 NAD(P)H-binding protein [Nocardia asteroides]
MRIGVFGASGVIGSRVVREAERRDHEVTAIARDAARLPDDLGARRVVADWLDADGIAAAIAELDVVISAVNVGHGIADTIAHADDFVAGAHAMVAALHRHPGVRLVVVGGGGSLEVAPGLQLVDTGAAFTEVLTERLGVPAEYRAVVLALREALDVYRRSNRNWTYLSPSSGLVEPGERTGRYRVGGDQLLSGDADISAEDLAVALLDEVEGARFVQRRFTVAAA